MEKKQMNFKEYLLFLQGFLTNPQRVGSLIPSSRFLAAKVVESVPWDEVKTVAELGSGTGAITRCMKTQLTGSTKVLLFERDKKMRENLKAEYPDFVCHSNACQLVKKLNHDDIGQLDCIISGLSFSNFTSEMRETLLNQIMKALKPGGIFVAFQYSLQMKKRFAEDLTIEKIEFVPFNFPPAFVYICRKKEVPCNGYNTCCS
ncbi:class I SAM-dependent methyltransferase [Paenibacillus polymyxa]|uniref:class I SAM-dependent methyltransferase n=1 Tax=Paenibacillus TaxID=44249 RepID=UPI000F4D8CB3|nr:MULTISPECIES: methyltransferase domain-containing protein [Paenibacillus]KAF6654708.1 methyltransferase domain-containing protein [Paenibacillus sp. EKM301P]RPD99508.1 methyltransferase domain-containing protein [Paenibacillus polymyxa]UBS86684.1 methyltransferase domain-containing protein [Paenibacillus polymyxa]UNL93964.1 phospholipid methyltransferase [Paenibacillus polymyxa]WHX35214.1 methyltransferase domain-containing protein [Paenibacillus polymyxa]